MKYDDDDDEDTRIKAAATRALKLILVEELGGVGDEVVEPVARRVHVDQHTNNLHIRFQQFLRGLPVEGTSLNLHMSPQGNIFGLNGEFIPSGNMELRVLVDCHEAMESVRIESGSIGDDVSRWVWLSECVPAAVLGNDGLGHLCWKRTLEVQRPGQPPHREVLFASGVNGRLVARHPRTFGARSLETRDCKSLTDNCAPVSKSSDPISTGDAAVDAAHNNAIRVYDFLKSAYGRDSLDGNGMTIISQAHYDVTCESGTSFVHVF
jgi:Zn-dependent metalloprotease